MAFRDKELRNQLKKLERIRDIWDNKDYNESCKKAQRMSTHSCLDWIDTHLIDIGRAATDYRKHGDEAYLQELRKAVSILQALTEELMARQQARS